MNRAVLFTCTVMAALVSWTLLSDDSQAGNHGSAVSAGCSSASYSGRSGFRPVRRLLGYVVEGVSRRVERRQARRAARQAARHGCGGSYGCGASAGCDSTAITAAAAPAPVSTATPCPTCPTITLPTLGTITEPRPAYPNFAGLCEPS